MDRDLDVLQNYRNITNKVRKRLLRKPNYAEASDQFGTLTKVLKNQECYNYAGFCCLAKARCENTLVNPPGETDALVESARLFFKAEKLNVEIKCPSFEDQLTEAVHCYNQAIKIYRREGHYPLAAMLSLELASNLEDLEKTEEAFKHYVRASELQRQYSVMDSWSSARKAATCKILVGDYHTALRLISNITAMVEAFCQEDASILTSSVQELLKCCEIDQVFLLLLLQPSPLQMNADHAKVMEKYIWDTMEDSHPNWIAEELFLLLQSVIMVVQGKDVKSLKDVEEELGEHFSSWQYQLFYRLIESLTKAE